MNREKLKELPKIDEVLSRIELHNPIAELGRSVVVNAIRIAVDRVRKDILAGNDVESPVMWVIENTHQLLLRARRPSLHHVINATGVVLHTNLGRARLSSGIKEELWRVASSYSTLEYDVEQGRRGSRYSHVVELLKQITGAEDAIVVNNNAAAVLLALSTLAKGREAIVSRGQLIEIGGSFRIPEVMEQSGALLREIGATNKTHLRDYENALSEQTAIILKVHTSNYRIVGFTSEVSTRELVALAHKNDIPVLEDLGSGVLIDMRKFGLSYEPTVQEVVNAGVDVVTFSGDKLLGGPQAGIIVGKTEYVERMKRNALNRALRIDKMTLAALEGTLRLYLDEEKAVQDIPTLRMLALTQADLRKRAQGLAQMITEKVDGILQIEVVDMLAQVGGGALPQEDIPSAGFAIMPRHISASELETRLRRGYPPVITRIEQERVLFDLRTVACHEEFSIVESLIVAMGREEE